MLRPCCTAAAALAVALLIAGCSKKPEAACPQGLIPLDASKITRFRDGPGRDLTDVLVTANVQNILVDDCNYTKNAVDVRNFQIAITADRGPADRSRAADFQYWVAVVDPQRNILTRKTFPLHIAFPDNLTRVGTVIDDLQLHIPMTDTMKAPTYQIIVGFQLTPDELAWNRSHRPDAQP